MQPTSTSTMPTRGSLELLPPSVLEAAGDWKNDVLATNCHTHRQTHTDTT